MTKCKKCGSQCLGDKKIKTCNNCDPHISKLIRDVASYEISEDDELTMDMNEINKILNRKKNVKGNT